MKLSREGNISVKCHEEMWNNIWAWDIPSKKSTASDLKSLYVNSKMGHMFGEMRRDLYVKASTRSKTLSYKSGENNLISLSRLDEKEPYR